MADTGNGATLTRSGFTVDIVGISVGNMTLDVLDKTLLNDTGHAKKLPADISDAGTITVDYLFDSDDAIPTLGEVSSTTITWPLATGQTTAANLAGTAIVTDIKLPDFRNNELQTAQVTFTWDGVTGPTYTPAS